MRAILNISVPQKLKKEVELAVAQGGMRPKANFCVI
jgi:hypothetical protein